MGRANAIARDRDQQAQLAAAAERTRISREMHDVVAHSLTVMVALADGAKALGARTLSSRARRSTSSPRPGGPRSPTCVASWASCGTRTALSPLAPTADVPSMEDIAERFRHAACRYGSCAWGPAGSRPRPASGRAPDRAGVADQRAALCPADPDGRGRDRPA
ncbi:histidine kinase dimerization/phosphoacceptor domain-containing protein [Oerskovia sp. M15]